MRGQESVLEIGEGGEDDREERRSFEVGLGQEPDFVEGILADELGLVDPEEESGGEVFQGLNEEARRLGASPS